MTLLPAGGEMNKQMSVYARYSAQDRIITVCAEGEVS